MFRPPLVHMIWLEKSGFRKRSRRNGVASDFFRFFPFSSVFFRFFPFFPCFLSVFRFFQFSSVSFRFFLFPFFSVFFRFFPFLLFFRVAIFPFFSVFSSVFFHFFPFPFFLFFFRFLPFFFRFFSVSFSAKNGETPFARPLLRNPEKISTVIHSGDIFPHKIFGGSGIGARISLPATEFRDFYRIPRAPRMTFHSEFFLKLTSSPGL